MKNIEDILHHVLNDLNLNLSDDITNKIVYDIDLFLNELLLFNSKFSLVNVYTKEDLLIKHVLDSLSGISYFLDLLRKKNFVSIADVGSGAGLPGIPIAICFRYILPHTKITLIERMKKRCTFLNNVKAMIGLGNVDVLESDVKDVKLDFDIVTCRALTTLDCNVFSMLYKITSTSGFLVLYKGNIEKSRQEIFDIKDVDFQNVNIIPIFNPYLKAERCLISVRKN